MGSSSTTDHKAVSTFHFETLNHPFATASVSTTDKQIANENVMEMLFARPRITTGKSIQIRLFKSPR